MEGAVVAELRGAVGERGVREACELFLTRALDPATVPHEATEQDEGGQKAEAEEKGEADELRELAVVGRPCVGAARKDGLGAPGADCDRQRAEEKRKRPEGAAVENAYLLDGGEEDFDHGCVWCGGRWVLSASSNGSSYEEGAISRAP